MNELKLNETPVRTARNFNINNIKLENLAENSVQGDKKILEIIEANVVLPTPPFPVIAIFIFPPHLPLLIYCHKVTKNFILINNLCKISLLL